MSVFIAMLRGINVGGAKPVKMERLRESFENLGFQNIKTYLQSGNVVFESSGGDSEALESKIGKCLKKDFKFEIPVVVRSKAEMMKVVAKNPFLRGKGAKIDHLYVVFLAQTPQKSAIQKVEALPETREAFELRGKEVYLHFPDGYGNAKRNNNYFEKILSVTATTRNWKTVMALAELASH